MKVKSIVGKANEYNRLQRMIDNINASLKTFDKAGKDAAEAEGSGEFTPGRPLSFCLDFSDFGEIVKVNPEVTDLIKNDVISILNEQLSLLVAQQEALEV